MYVAAVLLPLVLQFLRCCLLVTLVAPLSLYCRSCRLIAAAAAAAAVAAAAVAAAAVVAAAAAPTVPAAAGSVHVHALLQNSLPFL